MYKCYYRNNSRPIVLTVSLSDNPIKFSLSTLRAKISAAWSLPPPSQSTSTATPSRPGAQLRQSLSVMEARLSSSASKQRSMSSSTMRMASLAASPPTALSLYWPPDSGSVAMLPAAVARVARPSWYGQRPAWPSRRSVAAGASCHLSNYYYYLVLLSAKQTFRY